MILTSLFSLMTIVASNPGLAVPTPPPIAAGETNAPVDEAAIQQLMAQFHKAVVAHDGPSLFTLFTQQAGLFNVLTDAALDRVREKTPAAPKARWASARQFADFVTHAHTSLDPVHTNLSIHTDGTIATVWFDFVFLIDGKAENSGSETWQLVKTGEGWKIASTSYSSRPR